VPGAPGRRFDLVGSTLVRRVRAVVMSIACLPVVGVLLLIVDTNTRRW
jgi:hypothetical protein